ncbi:hypothetical protein Tco_1195323 [Tanacetum coccineum]
MDKTPVLKNSFPVAWRILFTFVIQVLGGNYSSTEQVNSIQQLLAYCLITGTEVDIGEIIYSDLVTKLLNKSSLKYVSYPRFISCALQVLLGSDYTQDEKFGFLPGIPSNSNFTKDPSKVTDIELMTHMIAINNHKDSVALRFQEYSLRRANGLSPKSHPLRPSTRLPSTLDEGTRKSQPLPESTATSPKDSGEKIQPLDKDLPSMTSDKGTVKTTPRPEGSLGDKESRGNIPPTDMEPIHPAVADLLGTGAKYQVDQTQSTRLSEEDILGAGKEMDEEPQVASIAKTHHQSPPPQADQSQSSHAPSTEASDTDSSCDDILKKYDNTLLLTERQLAHALKQDEELAAWAKSSTNMAWNLGSRLSGQPSGNVTPTLALTHIPANVEEENADNTGTEEPLLILRGRLNTQKWQFQLKGIATESDEYSLKKLVPASTIIRPDPNEEKAAKEERLLAIYKPEVIKVVQEEAEKIGLDPKKIVSAKAGEKFKKASDAEHQTKPVVITVYRGTYGRNFDVHKPFSFGVFGIYELDKLREIIPKKKNTVVQDLMNSLSQRYERIRKIPEELEIKSALPAPEQAPSKSSRKKRKHMKLESEVKIPRLECNRALPENDLFVNNMVIEEPEYGIFFTDEFGDQAFQRWSDIDKVGMEALLSYLVVASMVKSPENARFSMKLKKLIAEHPDQEKLKSKKVKLEALGYEMN